MSTPSVILLGADREGCALDAAAHAARLSAVFEARLHVAHVVEPTRRPWFVRPDLPGEKVRQLGEEAIRGFRPLCPAGTTFHFRYGHPVKELLAICEEIGADLLVLGRHHEGLLDPLVGGTAQGLIRRARCPLLVHKDVSIKLPRAILAAVDLSPDSEPLLADAVDWAAALGSSVIVLYVFEPPAFCYDAEGDLTPHYTVDRIREQEADRLSELVAATRWGSVPHDTVVLEGPPGPLILETAQHHGADLVFVGSHGRTAIDRLLVGSVAEHVLRRSNASVLVRRQEDAGRAPSWT